MNAALIVDTTISVTVAAKAFLEDGAKTLKKMGITPMTDDSPNSYTFDARRFFSGRLSNSPAIPIKTINRDRETVQGSMYGSMHRTAITNHAREVSLQNKISGSIKSRALGMSKSAPAVNMRPKTAPPTCESRKNLRGKESSHRTALVTKKSIGFK